MALISLVLRPEITSTSIINCNSSTETSASRLCANLLRILFSTNRPGLMTAGGALCSGSNITFWKYESRALDMVERDSFSQRYFSIYISAIRWHFIIFPNFVWSALSKALNFMFSVSKKLSIAFQCGRRISTASLTPSMCVIFQFQFSVRRSNGAVRHDTPLCRFPTFPQYMCSDAV